MSCSCSYAVSEAELEELYGTTRTREAAACVVNYPGKGLKRERDVCVYGAVCRWMHEARRLLRIVPPYHYTHVRVRVRGERLTLRHRDVRGEKEKGKGGWRVGMEVRRRRLLAPRLPVGECQ